MMKFNVSVPELKRILSQTKDVLAKTDTIPVYKSYLLIGDSKTGKIVVYCSNQSLTAIASMKAQFTEDFIVTVSGDKLHRAILGVPCDFIELDIDGKDTSWSVGAESWKFIGRDPAEFTERPAIPSSMYAKAVTKTILNCMRRVSFSICDDNTLKPLLAVKLSGGCMLATTGAITSMIKCPVEGTNSEVIIPAASVQGLLGILAGTEATDLEIGEEGNTLVFHIGEIYFLSKKSQAAFPDLIKRVDEPTRDVKDAFEVDKDVLRAAVKHAAITTDEKTVEVVFAIAPDSMIITSKDTDGNSYKNTIQCKWNAAATTMSINHERWIEVMESVVSEKPICKVHAQLGKPLRIEDGDFTAFVMRTK